MTVQELYDKVMASEEFQKSFLEAAQDQEKLEAWLKANGCEATAEQVAEFFKSRQGSGELSDDELEGVAGGKWIKRTYDCDGHLIQTIECW